MAEANISQVLRNAPRAPGTPAPGAPGQNQWFESFFNFKGASPIQLPPELLAKQLRGIRASQQLAGIEKEREALAKKQYKAPEGLGYDGVYQAANPVGHIGALMSGFANDQKSRDLAEQAKALRYQAGDDEAATAEMQFALGGQKGSDALGWAKFMHEMQKYQQDRFDKYNEFTGDAKQYVDKKTGEIKWLRPTKYGYKDTDTDKYMPLTSNFKELGSNEIFDRVPEKLHTQAASYRALYTSTMAVQDAAKKLTEKDMQDLSQPALMSTIEAFAPATLDAYLREHKIDLSDNAKAYLERTANLDAIVKHELYGAALTGGERSDFNKFATNADALDFKGRMRRLNSLMTGVLAKGRSLVDSPKFDQSIYSDLGEFDFWTPEYEDIPEGPVAARVKEFVRESVINPMSELKDLKDEFNQASPIQLPELSAPEVQQLLRAGNFAQLKDYMNQNYSDLSKEELTAKATEMLKGMSEDEQKQFTEVFKAWMNRQ